MALVSGLVGVGAAVLLSVVCSLSSAVCCSLFVVCCLLSTFVICSLFVRCLFTLCTLSFRSLFVLCSLYVCCRHLFASCMPAAVGRKIKYRFHAWQAPEVFSKRQPLIFSHNLCHCGSFFSSRLCGIYVMCVLHQYSCLRPSGRCRVKRPFSTTFSSHFHNGSISRDSVPLRHGFHRGILSTGLLRGIALPSRFHNGSVSRDSVPLRYHALEGADRSGLSPPPSRIRYKRTCPRSVPRRPCPGTPSGRCRRKCRLPVTFSFWYVESLHSFGRGCQIPAFSDSFGRSHRAFFGAVPLVDVVKPFSL